MVKPGYKQTEIGVIPEEWEVQTLETVYDLFAGGDLNPNDYSEVPTGDFRFGIFSNSLADRGLYGYCRFPQFEGNAITITGQGDIGHCRYREQPFCAIIRLLVCQPKQEISSQFVSEYLESTKPFVFESTGVPQLTVPQIQNVLIPVPPISEQRQISCTLSQTDDLILRLEQLIAKKKAILQGTMQKLLRDKKRLPGFSADWKSYAVADCADLLDHLRVPIASALRTAGTVPYYGANGIQDYVDGYTHNGTFVLLAEDGARDLQNYPVQYISGKVWVNNHAHVLCGKEGIANTLFLYYAFQMVDFRTVLVGGTRAKLNGSVLKEMRLSLPAMDEQEAIAEVLSNMDSEMNSLEQKLLKVQQLKQGMMQQLLTGKIRLV